MQDIPENAADEAHFGIVHNPFNFMAINLNRELIDKISKYIRLEWNAICSEDTELKHIFHIKATDCLYQFGYKIVEGRLHIKNIGPAHSIIVSDVIFLKILRIPVLTSIAIISTGPLTQKTILHFYSGSSILEKLFVNLLNKLSSIDVSNQQNSILNQFTEKISLHVMLCNN